MFVKVTDDFYEILVENMKYLAEYRASSKHSSVYIFYEDLNKFK